MKNKQQIKYLAQALLNVCQGKSAKQIDQILDNLWQLLRAQGRLADLPVLIATLKDLQLAAKGVVQVQVVSTHVLQEAELKLVHKLAKQLTDQELILATKIDKELIGGVILKHQDKILDLSLRQRINQLNEALIN